MVKILNYLLRIVYGGLTVVACAVSLPSANNNFVPYVIMLAGGMMLLLSTIKKLNKSAFLLLALALIQISAIWNGLNSGFHLSHHIVRLCISALIFAIHWLAVKNKN